MHTAKHSFPLTPVADTGPLVSGESDAAHALVSEPSYLGLKQNRERKRRLSPLYLFHLFFGCQSLVQTQGKQFPSRAAPAPSQLGHSEIGVGVASGTGFALFPRGKAQEGTTRCWHLSLKQRKRLFVLRCFCCQYLMQVNMPHVCPIRRKRTFH